MSKRMASMAHEFFDKKIGFGMKANVNEVLAQELYKPVIKKFKNEKSESGLKIIIGQ